MKVSISRDGSELGEWTEEEVRVLYAEGKLLLSDHYWKEGMTAWSTLDKLIKPPPPTGKPKPAPQVAPHKATAKIIPASDDGVPFTYKGLKGSGASRDDPIEIIALNNTSSAWSQNDVLDAMFGKTGYDRTKNRRLYSESPSGRPGNGDLCETVVTLSDGTERSVWFDLHMVTRIVSQNQKDNGPKAPRLKHQSHPSAATPQRNILEGGLDLLSARELNIEDEFLKGFQAIANKGRAAIVLLLISIVCFVMGGVGTLEQNGMSNLTWLGFLSYCVGVYSFARFRRVLYGLPSAVVGSVVMIVAPFLTLAYVSYGHQAFKEQLENLMLKLDWKGKVGPRF